MSSSSAMRRRRTNSNNSEAEPSPSSSVESAALLPLASNLPNMGCKDRTQEFRSVVRTLQSTNQANGPTYAGARPKTHMKTEFNTIAKRISHDLANTYAKLEKLTLLARRKSLFDDKAAEILHLTEIIKQDLTSLNTQIGHLQELSKATRGENGIHKQTHSNSVVVALQSKLAGMSGDFKSVLEVRTENLKQQKARRDEFSQGPSSTSLPAGVLSGNLGSVLLQDEAMGRSSTSPGGYTVVNLDGVARQRQQQQQLQLIDEQDAYIQGRADTMANIEQTIVELGGIFQQLAHMVHEQEELVQRIDSNVEETHLNIDAAHGELVKYFQSVTSNRWLMIKIFGVLIFFFIIFIIFLA